MRNAFFCPRLYLSLSFSFVCYYLSSSMFLVRYCDHFPSSTWFRLADANCLAFCFSKEELSRENDSMCTQSWGSATRLVVRWRHFLLSGFCIVLCCVAAALATPYTAIGLDGCFFFFPFYCTCKRKKSLEEDETRMRRGGIDDDEEKRGPTWWNPPASSRLYIHLLLIYTFPSSPPPGQ